MAIPDPDGPLALSRERLNSAVHALADEIPIWDRGAARWSDALYSRLRAALVSRTARTRAVASSRPPLRSTC